MSNQQLILFNPKSVKTTNPARLLGRQLIEDGHITTTDLVHALEQQSKMDAQLGDILVANGTLSSQALFATLATQSNAQHVDLNNDPYHAQLVQHPLCTDLPKASGGGVVANGQFRSCRHKPSRQI